MKNTELSELKKELKELKQRFNFLFVRLVSKNILDDEDKEDIMRNLQ